MRYAYETLRMNCKRRKGEGWFELTFDEFKQYAVETNYIAGKGRTVNSYSIDCIDPTMGYFIGNIRPLKFGDNSRKHTKVLHYEWDENQGRMVAFLSKSEDKIKDEKDPF